MTNEQLRRAKELKESISRNECIINDLEQILRRDRLGATDYNPAYIEVGNRATRVVIDRSFFETVLEDISMKYINFLKIENETLEKQFEKI